MSDDPRREAFREGRRAGLAIAAIAASAVAFVSLLGIEKAILAAVLAVLAMRGATRRSRTTRLARLAIGIAALYAVSFAVLLVLFRDKVWELLRLLQQMG
jgi:NADH:ubiquinone oxidoreductase subunit K